MGSNCLEREATKWRAAGVRMEALSSLTGARISIPSECKDLLSSWERSLST